MNRGTPRPQVTTLSFPPATIKSTGAKSCSGPGERSCVQLPSYEARRMRGESRRMPLAGFSSGRLRVRRGRSALFPPLFNSCDSTAMTLQNDTRRLRGVLSRLLLRSPAFPRGCGAAASRQTRQGDRSVGSSDLPRPLLVMLLACDESDGRRAGLEKSPESEVTCGGGCSG